MASALFRKLNRTSKDVEALRKIAPREPRAERLRYSKKASLLWELWRAAVSEEAGFRLDARPRFFGTFYDLLKAARIPGFLRGHGSDLAARSKKYMQSVARIEVKIPNEGLRIEEYVEENIKLITGLAEEQIGLLTKILDVALRAGLRSETIAPDIRKILDVGESRIQLIARDQTLKGAALFNRLAQTSAGVEEYTWLTAKDERVRPEHAVLHGQTFRFTDPPDTGNGYNNPGEDIQCRCVPVPIIPLFAGI